MSIPIYGFPNYQISEQGIITNIKNGRFLKPQASQANYLSVNLYRKGKSHSQTIHSLVAEHFLPNPDNYKYVIHINGNTNDNSLSNLKWNHKRQIIPKDTANAQRTTKRHGVNSNRIHTTGQINFN